jgi:hypothetical protein
MKKALAIAPADLPEPKSEAQLDVALALTREQDERRAWDQCLIAAAIICAARQAEASITRQHDPMSDVVTDAILDEADSLLEGRRKRWGQP